MAVGRAMLVSGVLILLFIPYLLWGTGLQTARIQSHLRGEFRAAQQRAGALPTTTPTAGNGTGQAAQVAPVVPDPPTGGAVGVITIPKIGVSMVVVEGIGEAQLQAGPGHYPGTPLPGEAGNAAVAGHRTTYLHPFYNLNDLVPGDSITITTLQGIFLYHVTGSMAVSPSDVAVVGPSTTPQLTLTTCNPRYSASQRLVVHGALVASILVRPKAVPVPVPPRSRAASTTPARNWTAAILWGVVVVALTAGLWIAAGRTQRSRRAVVIGAGLVVWLGVVFFFFGSVAPLLPASF
jgi:sortase A